MQKVPTPDPTVRNLHALEKFLSAVQKSHILMLLSGSLAYGPNYAVHETSDVDSLITATSLEDIRHVIDACITAGLYPPSVRERFAVFERLYKEGRAETFSVRTQIDGVDVGTDFLPWEVVERICTLAPMETRVCSDPEGNLQVRVAREFRPKLPARVGGYSLDDLHSNRKVIFTPEYVALDSGGYLYDTPVDARSADGTGYYIGLLSFYFSVSPVILMDEKGKLEDATASLQQTIALRGGSAFPTYVTREERMDAATLVRIKSSLSCAATVGGSA